MNHSVTVEINVAKTLAILTGQVACNFWDWFEKGGFVTGKSCWKDMFLTGFI